ncbi:MAG: hypothetical protein AAF449_19815 [Myxococcota bacterium]
MAGLSPDWVLRVHKAAMGANLSESRAALLRMLPPDARAQMEGEAGPVAVVILKDLTTLSDMAGAGNSAPLLLWLRTAELLAAAFRESAQTFAEARAVVESNDSSPARPDAPETRPTGQTLSARVRDFLTSAFSVSELQALVAETTPDILNSVNWGQSLSQVSFDLVSALQRRGQLDDTFFNALVQLRPGRRLEVQRLRQG